MARVVFNGEAGERYTNGSGKVLYQFVASLSNTCGVCLQYHMAVGPWWPIPMHRGCQCRQLLVPPGAQAPEPSVDFRELLAGMPPDQQTKAVGRANFTMLEKGVVSWDDVVTKGRVRTLREVVSRKKLSVEDMVKAGVDLRTAREAHKAVNTPEHQLRYEQRRGLVKDLKKAGLTDGQIRQGFGTKTAERVGVVKPGPETVAKTGPKWTDGASLAKLLKLDAAKVAKALAEMPLVRHGAGTTPDQRKEFDAWVDSLPPEVRAGLKASGVTFEHVRRIEDFDPALAARQMPGWAKGMTAANADGLYDFRERMVILARERLDTDGEYRPTLPKRARGVFLHETGHAVDHARGGTKGLSGSKEFRDAHAADAARLTDADKKKLAYYLRPDGRGAAEVFAETFANLNGAATVRKSVGIIATAFRESAKIVHRLTRPKP